MIEAIAQALQTDPDGLMIQDGSDRGRFWIVGIVYPMNGDPALILNTENNQSWVLSLERYS